MERTFCWTVYFELKNIHNEVEINFDIFGETKRKAIKNAIEEAEEEIAHGFVFKSISKTDRPRMAIVESAYE